MSVLRLPQLPTLRALRHRNFTLLWLGSLVCNVGTWMEAIALGVYVTTVTGRAEWTGGLAALTFLPALVLSPLGGGLADRFDRRRCAALCTLVQALLAGLLTALAFAGRLSVEVVAAASFLNGCMSTLATPAFLSLIAESVPTEELHSALSLNSMQNNFGRVFGPGLAAVVLATGDISWALCVNALSFVAVLLALARVRLPVHVTRTSLEGLWAGIAHGVQVARRDEGIWLALMGTLGVAFFISPFTALVPVLALRVFQQDAAAASMLVTAQGLGSLTAALLSGSLANHLGSRRMHEGGLLLIGPVAAVYWLSPSLLAAAVAIYALGALYMVTLTGMLTVCQSRVPRELQARISGLFSMLLFGGFTVGAWLQGALADRLGVRLITASAAMSFLALAVVMRALRPRGFAALEL